MKTVPDKNFFSRPATELAPELIGKLLCRRLESGVMRARITETECYYGEEDSACHAHRGKTPRNSIIYGKGGVAYVYLCYGIHSLLNIVTGPEGHPEAVLIRGVEGFSGPGRLTKGMHIGLELNGYELKEGGELWIEDDGVCLAYRALPRVGIGYADEKDRLAAWRYLAE